MANKNLFKPVWGKLGIPADTWNNAGAVAYKFKAEHALAQYAATGCLNDTYYADAAGQLKEVSALCNVVNGKFIAQTALYCRQKGFMKDMPALLCAALLLRDPESLRKVFGRVMDDAKMVRNFVQIIRSGVLGRKSLGTVAKRLVQQWLESRTDEQLFKASVGQDPSLADVIKMVHPKPANERREALYAYLIGRPHKAELLPPVVQAFEAYKGGQSLEVPDVPFQMLTALKLGTAEWSDVARRASWQTTRMNLNTFARHGVFAQPELVEIVARRLRDPEAIGRARVFPYQLLMAYVSAGAEVPVQVKEALQDAMELAIQNVPTIKGKVYVCPDVSGSMSGSISGFRPGATSAVRCIDVAALVAAAVLRKNPEAEVLPFEQSVCDLALNPRDSVMTNAGKLAAIGGGGTNCSAPLALLNQKKAEGDLVIFVSDNESWMDAGRGRGTATQAEWNEFKARNPGARLVCIDIQPNGNSQAQERADILNIGGFSDQVFGIISLFASGQLNPDHWVGIIGQMDL